LTVTDGAACPLDPVVAPPLVRVTSGSRQRLTVEMPPQRRPIRMLADPQPTLPAPSPDGADHRRSVILVGAVAAPLVRTPPRRVGRIGVAVAFFPPRSETSRRSRSPRPRAPPRSAAHKRSLGSACAGGLRTGATARFLSQDGSRLALAHAAQQEHDPSRLKVRGGEDGAGVEVLDTPGLPAPIIDKAAPMVRNSRANLVAAPQPGQRSRFGWKYFSIHWTLCCSSSNSAIGKIMPEA
jgi:hypothetical protein